MYRDIERMKFNFCSRQTFAGYERQRTVRLRWIGMDKYFSILKDCLPELKLNATHRAK